MIPLAKRLKQRIQIESLLAVKDGHGGTVRSWVPFENVAAEVGATAGGRVRQTSKGGEEDIATLPIRIRYLAGINDQMRVAYRGQYYSIDNVDNERQANRTMLLACRAMPAGSA